MEKREFTDIEKVIWLLGKLQTGSSKALQLLNEIEEGKLPSDAYGIQLITSDFIEVKRLSDICFHILRKHKCSSQG